tara:strand:- start:466 stop:621 length:156 start_codon:yes stop_codon:yes gene_type:complete
LYQKWRKSLKTFSTFLLLIYWSVIILAPVIAKDQKKNLYNPEILPLKKPLN